MKCLVVIFCLVAGFANAEQPQVNVGFRLVELSDPVSQKPMKAAVFYPTEDRADSSQIGEIEIAARRDARVQGGRHPLILLSHGSGGSLFGHQDTAVFLARRGFLVAAVEHPGDNFRDESGLGTDRVLIGRSMQMSAMLDAVLSEAPFSTAVDAARIGVAGFSAGGYTALMVGAKPKFSLLKAHCSAHPTSVLCGGGGIVGISAPPLAAKADPRIRAAFVMSPVAAYFDRDSLSAIFAPVDIYAAASDSVLPTRDNARWVRDNLPSRASYTEIPGADHFVFLSPCSLKMESIMPRLCRDAPGIDRRALHEAINSDLSTFFQVQLGVR